MKPDTTARQFPTRIDIAPDVRGRMIALVDQQLADLLDLGSQIKHAHWNVKGPQFIQLHELFDELAGEIADHADTVAERAVALGGTAHGTLRMGANASRLEEYPADAVDGLAHVAALSDRFAALGKTTRAAIRAAAEAGDDDTADVFTEVSRDLDKKLWFLEAHLQAAKG